MILQTATDAYLRPFVAADLPDLCRLFADPEVMRFSLGVRDLEATRGWLDDAVSRFDAGDPIVPYALVDGGSSAILGFCGFFRLPDVNGREEIELGYRLFPAHWNRGRATAAGSALVTHAFDALGLTRLVSLIDPDNAASIRVAEKLGMVHAGEAMLPGYDHPDRVYVVEISDAND